MPTISIDLKCSMVGVTNLKPADVNDFRWYIKVKCTMCGEAPETYRYIVAEEFHPIPGSRGEANLVEKCKLCNRLNTLTLLPDTYGTYVIEKNEKWQPLVSFDCRGIEPVEFDPRDNWVAEGPETGTLFEGINLAEKAWADYDEKAGEATEINDVEFRFHASK